MKKNLPLSKPFISCYPQHAFYMSIISEKKECLPWIFSNYSNLFIDENGFCDFFVKTPEYYLYPWFQGSQRLHRDFLIEHNIELIKFIKDNLNNNNYIWLHVDEFNLPCSDKFNKQHFIHSQMISGFDDMSQKFTINGYYNKKKYSTEYVNYEDLSLSFYKAKPDMDFKFYIHLIKYNTDYRLADFTYNLSLLKQQLLCYLNSSLEPLLNPEEIYNLNIKNSIVTGLDLYAKLITELKNHSYVYSSHRIFYILFEHKKFMLLKLNYLKTENFFTFSDEIFSKYDSILKITEIQLFLFLKYKLTGNKELLEKIIELLSTIKKDEKEVLELMIDQMNCK